MFIRDNYHIHFQTYIVILYADAQQLSIGSCVEKDIAAKVATRVMGHYPHRNQLLVDCGFTALSHDGKGQLKEGSWCLIEGHPELK